MKTYSIQIAAGVGQTQRIDVHGTFIKVVSLTATCLARLERVGNPQNNVTSKILADGLELTQGDKPKYPEYFDALILTNTTGALVSGKIIVGEGDIDSDAVAGTVNVGNQSGSTFDSSADATLTASSSYDIAADTARRELLLQAPTTNTGELVVRDQSATTSEGFRLYPGGHLILANYGAVRVRNNTGATQVLHVSENKG